MSERLPLNRAAGLAPMAGVADAPFRRLCRAFGAAFTVSEMISAKGLCYGSDGSFALCRITPEEHPMGLQLFGSDPESIARACALIAPFEPDWIDLNMGCPVKKVVRDGSGCALMRDTALAQTLVRAAVRETDKPVTVKMRLGWDESEENAVPFARAMEEAGAAAVTVHGRFAAQLYAGHADWDAIRRVKEAVTIPVVGNGDIKSADDAVKMFTLTWCDLVLVGRGSYGNPFLFREIAAALRGETVSPPTVEEKMETMLCHIRSILALSDKPEKKAMCEARKHASWYVSGLPRAAALRRKCYELCTYSDAERLADEVMRCASGANETG